MTPEHEKIAPAGLGAGAARPEPESAAPGSGSGSGSGIAVAASAVAPTGASADAEAESRQAFRRQLALSALAGCAMNLDGRHLLDMARDAWALADAMLYSEEEDQSDLWPYEAQTQVEPQSQPEPQPESKPEPVPWPFKTPEQLRAEAVEAARQAHNARIARLQATPEAENTAPARPVSLFAAWNTTKPAKS